MKKVCVVEDNADNRLLLQAILEDLYEVVEYEAGPEALAGWERSVPDLILMDISLPGMDGVALLSKVRGHDSWKHIPVIALTAHAMVGDRARYLQAGFDDYISKPIVDESVLLNAIDRLLAGSGTVRDPG